MLRPAVHSWGTSTFRDSLRQNLPRMTRRWIHLLPSHVFNLMIPAQHHQGIISNVKSKPIANLNIWLSFAGSLPPSPTVGYYSPDSSASSSRCDPFDEEDSSSSQERYFHLESIYRAQNDESFGSVSLRLIDGTIRICPRFVINWTRPIRHRFPRTRRLPRAASPHWNRRHLMTRRDQCTAAVPGSTPCRAHRPIPMKRRAERKLFERGEKYLTIELCRHQNCVKKKNFIFYYF